MSNQHQQDLDDVIKACEYWIEHESENLTYADQEIVFSRLSSVCAAKAERAREMDEQCK
jgi:hypothetical protein